MKKSILIALGVFALVVLIFVVGIMVRWLTGGTDSAEDSSAARPLLRVRVQEREAETVWKEVIISGRTAPAREVVLRAETAGKVVETGTPRGQSAGEGDLLVRLEVRDRAKRVEYLEALVRQRQTEFEAAQDLSSRGLQSRNLVAQAEANLEQAKADLEQARVDLANTEIRAPFDGFLAERTVEIGDFVRPGETVGRFLELDPLIITGEVTELEVLDLSKDQEARVVLSNGSEFDGRVRFLSPYGDPASRTFTVEAELPNPDGFIPAGITAQARIETEARKAHYLSPALLSLDGEGRIGVKFLDGDDRVRFAPAVVVRSGGEGIWLAGLPERLRLITVGQGFARIGERVEPVPAEDEPLMPVPERVTGSEAVTAPASVLSSRPGVDEPDAPTGL